MKPLQTLTVHYAGIIALVLKKNEAGAMEGEALLVDVGKTQGVDENGNSVRRAQHYASLSADCSKWLTGSNPDFVTTRGINNGGADFEQGVYGLDRCNVTFLPDVPQAFAPDLRAVSDGELTSTTPAPSLTSLNFMADVAKLTGAKAISTSAPLIARVAPMIGKVQAQATDATIANEFTFSLTQVSIPLEKRVVAARFTQIVAFEDSVTIEIEKSFARDRKLVIARRDDGKDNTNVVISNLCPCAEAGAQDHFYAYYELLANPAQRPKIHSKPRGGQNPLVDPEHCIDALINLL